MDYVPGSEWCLPDGRQLDIPTAMSVEEAAELARLSAGRTVLEIGAWYGFSTCVIASTAKEVVSVDPHRVDEWDGRTPGVWSFETWRANVDKYAACPVTAVVGRSPGVLAYLSNVFDMAFIDGDHSYDAVLADGRECVALMQPFLYGILVFHDYGRVEGVMEAVQQLISDAGGSLRGRGVTGSLAVVDGV